MTLLGFRKILTIREDHTQLEEPALPEGLFLARDSALPGLEIQQTLCISLRLRIETKGVVSSPLLALLIQTIHAQRHVGAVGRGRGNEKLSSRT